MEPRHVQLTAADMRCQLAAAPQAETPVCGLNEQTCPPTTDKTAGVYCRPDQPPTPALVRHQTVSESVMLKTHLIGQVADTYLNRCQDAEFTGGTPFI